MITGERKRKNQEWKAAAAVFTIDYFFVTQARCFRLGYTTYNHEDIYRQVDTAELMTKFTDDDISVVENIFWNVKQKCALNNNFWKHSFFLDVTELKCYIKFAYLSWASVSHSGDQKWTSPFRFWVLIQLESGTAVAFLFAE